MQLFRKSLFLAISATSPYLVFRVQPWGSPGTEGGIPYRQWNGIFGR